MYNLHLSPEQLEIRDTVRDFVAREVEPPAIEPKRLEARARPLLLDVLDKASQMGLRTLALSEDAGGAGADNLTCCIVTEELAVGDPDVAAVLAQTSTLAHELFDRAMTDEQRGRFLPAFLNHDRYHLALAEHEPDRDATLGINYHRPQSSDTPFKTTAERSGDAWIVNGLKDRVANAPLAGLFAVQVTTGAGMSTLLVPRGSPGLAVAEIAASSRWHHGAYGTVTFKDCRVPGENLLGPKGEARLPPTTPAVESRRIRRSILASVAPPTRPPSTTRSCGYRADAGSSSIRRSVESLPRSWSGSRLRAPRSGRRPGLPTIPTQSPTAAFPTCRLRTIAEAFVSDAIYHATKDAAECFGAMGVMKDMPLQKYVHDALICRHSGAGNSDAVLRIAEALAGYRRPANAAVLAAE